MTRLNQTPRATNIGYVYNPQVNNNVATVQSVRRDTYGVTSKKTIQDMEGEGFKEIIQSIYNKGKEGINYLFKNKDKIVDAYSGEIGTAIRNAIPDSDDTARPSFAGEKHGILTLPNGKYGTANYMGPGTNLIARLKRGDPPRTEVDKASMAHDIRYSLARNTDDIRKADNIMMNAVDRIARNRGDDPKNIAQARLIKLKTIGEDLGVIRRDAFSGDLANKEIDDKDRILMMSKIAGLAHEGYGMCGKGKRKILPGDALKLKILKQMAKQKMSGKGKKLTGITMDRDLGQPYQLKGQGMFDFLASTIVPALARKVGVSSDVISDNQIKNIVKKATSAIGLVANGKTGQATDIFNNLSSTILPILTKLKDKSMGGNGYNSVGYGKMKVKLIKSLSRGLRESFKHYIKLKQRKNNKNISYTKNLSGRGIAGMGFWDDFYTGFKSVFKPGAKILGGVATALGQPEFGIPLGLLSEAL